MPTLQDYLRLPWTIVVRFHDRDGGYWSAEVAELPGCAHQTANRADLLPQLEVILRMTLDTMLVLGEPIPEPGESAASSQPTGNSHRRWNDR